MNRLRRDDDDAQARPPNRALQSSPRSSSHRRTPSRRPVVMIADDTSDTRELYADYLRAKGFIVFTAGDGAAAVAVALEHAPDVIVMDLAMPQLDGLTATRKIKEDERARKARVILLTGYPMDSLPRQAFQAGVDTYLTKPCLPEELEGYVNRLRRPKGVL